MSKLYKNPELDFLTAGYESIAQMSLALADRLGYFDTGEYAIVNSFGDPSSAGLPYFIDPQPVGGHYEFLSYDGQSVICVEADFHVLVYRRPKMRLTYDQEYEMLVEFAAQFEPDSLIRTVLSDALLSWIQRNRCNPDIHTELARMKNVAYRLEDNIRRLEVLS